MLKFIVLGLVPGTHIQLTFRQIALSMIGFYGLIVILHVLHQFAKPAHRAALVNIPVSDRSSEETAIELTSAEIANAAL